MGRSYTVKYFAEDYENIINQKSEYPIYTGMNFADVFSNFILQNEGKVKGKKLVMFQQLKPAEKNTPVFEFLQDFEYFKTDKFIDPVAVWRKNNIYNEEKRGYYPYLKVNKHFIRKQLSDYSLLMALYWII